METETQSNHGWPAFLKLCGKFEHPEEFKDLFDLFLTLEEKEDIGKRYLILQAMLDGQMTQREIAEAIQVSISKVTRGSNALKIISDPLREALKKEML